MAHDEGEEPTQALGAEAFDRLVASAGVALPTRPGDPDDAREALVDALRRSDLPPEDETLPDEQRDLEQLAPPANVPDEEDEFDTATEVTSRAALADAQDSLDAADDLEVEDELFELQSEHPPGAERKGGSGSPPQA